MTRAAGRRSLALLIAACTLAACRREPQPAPLDGPSPDRLGPGEQLPESETAFGLPLPPGVRLVAQFKDAAYFAGKVDLQRALEHVAQHVTPPDAQLLGNGAQFPAVHVKGGSGQLLRIDMRKAAEGLQIHIEDITPAPVISGVSREEMWRKAGRNPDGTPIDPNQLY